MIRPSRMLKGLALHEVGFAYTHCCFIVLVSVANRAFFLLLSTNTLINGVEKKQNPHKSEFVETHPLPSGVLVRL